MSLLDTPVLTKFFSNKIESSHNDWRAYLLQVAGIFAMFDGEVYDRAQIEERFEAISGRSLDGERDTSNYRDEFGAYGSYLGVFRLKKINGQWRIELSNLARQFLCSAEPDVSSFCTLQLALFQYPNGMGYALQRNGTLRIQANIRENTQNEIMNRVKLSPFRLVCRCIVALHEIKKIPLSNIEIPYDAIFKLVNDDSINTTCLPAYSVILDAISSYDSTPTPNWLTKEALSKFKRNFHIVEQTGLMCRTRAGIRLSLEGIAAFRKIKTIAEISSWFSDFDSLCNVLPSEFKEHFEKIGLAQTWDKYYDGANLPLYVIQEIAGVVNLESLYDGDEGIDSSILPVSTGTFPALTQFSYHDRAQYEIITSKMVDIQAAIVAREKANCEHERILQMLNAHLLLLDALPCSNVFIDLYAVLQETPFLFEVKSTTAKNYISQIRKGISQLYEYRFRLGQPSAKLCLVLQSKPQDAWIINYLVQDRDIAVFWLVDDLRFECPVTCAETLSALKGIVHVEYVEST